jgi:hypothetical protein
MERKVSRGPHQNGNKNRAYNCQRTSVIEEDFIGNQGLERTIVDVEKKKTDVATPRNWLVSYKMYEGTITDCSVATK